MYYVDISGHFYVVLVEFVDQERESCSFFYFFGFFWSKCCFSLNFTTGLCFCLHSSRMIDIQTKMAGRALELLYLPEDQPCYLLDIG